MSLSEFPKRYNFKEIESKWQKTWENKHLYYFDRKDKQKPTYTIDTPPPYPSGELHVGNALNFTYIDFVARYKRMRGFNVLFPQGWDCHGLPTEVRVEKQTGKKKSEFDPEDFLRLCREYTLKWIEPMRIALKALGCSIDWSTEYRTMDPEYWRKTQLSFIELYRKGLIYRGEHPVNWCPRCETAIAEAEVEYVEVNRPLYYFKFGVEDGSWITIASTRPELLAACVGVAVNPEDERYKNIVGKKAIVPLYNYKVPIIADNDVDPEFGTGAVMICTFGDKTDVKWRAKYKLPLRIIINEKGLMTSKAGKELIGLSAAQARKKIVSILKEKGYLVKVESVRSSVGTCWRCHTPIEIIPRKQWFLKTIKLADKVLEEAKKIKWIPSYSRKRLEDWVNSLDWDWVISRQRLFATPIPVYYCKDCGNVIVAEPDWLPIDPRKDRPKIEKCPKCGSRNLVGETDVLDTWMDSSITAAVHAGWPDKMDERLFPADLQPNGYDIIRTWDYYLIVRGIALFGKTQFKTALINGMVRGTDGRMMHKSYGNYISLLEVLKKYGADVFRLWVATAAATGSDVRFSWEGLDYSKRFLTKLWNASRFIYMVIKDYIPREVNYKDLKILDKWIYSLSQRLVDEVTRDLENFDFMDAANKIIDFTWHKLCDHYLEAIKYRVSGNNNAKDKEYALYTLYKVLLNVITLLSVFVPHISEEIFEKIYKKYERIDSITIREWPKPESFNEEDIERGNVIVSVIAELRREKHDLRIPLNAPLQSIIIYSPVKYVELLNEGKNDISGTLRAKEVLIMSKYGEGRIVENYNEIKIKIVQ
ncbi:MAG: valine--tRNA ligase [Thermoproteales archaeon]|nr:valine--tRNA ligase [Thermoproteales archaeon]